MAQTEQARKKAFKKAPVLRKPYEIAEQAGMIFPCQLVTFDWKS
jgi:hypothetical protein